MILYKKVYRMIVAPRSFIIKKKKCVQNDSFQVHDIIELYVKTTIVSYKHPILLQTKESRIFFA